MNGRRTLMLAPFPVTGRLVVDAGEESEVLQGHLLLFDAQLVFQFPLRRPLDALDALCQG